MKRIRYISNFASPMDGAGIDAIVREAQEHNARDGITGILIATGTLFFQIIEGRDDKIDALFSRIAADPRHRHVMVLSTEQGEFARLCPDWAMRKVDLSAASSERNAPARALLEIAYAQRQLADQAVAALEAFTWRGFIDAELEALHEEDKEGR